MGMLTPDEAVQEQKKAFQKSAMAFGPGLKNQQQAQQTKLSDQVSDASARGAKQGGYNSNQAMSGMGGQIASEVSALASQQNVAQDKATAQMAGQEENIIGGRQKQALTNFSRDVGLQQQALAEVVAQQAFDMGIQSKELIFHQNKMVQDVAWNTLKKDYEEGRIDKQELADLAFKFKDVAQSKTDTAQYTFDQYMKSFMLNLEKGNTELAKSRIQEAFQIQLQAVQEAGRASNMASIFSGAGALLGGAVGFAVGGPGGAMVGAQAGSTAGGMANTWFN
jgi:hypothetical protein